MLILREITAVACYSARARATARANQQNSRRGNVPPRSAAVVSRHKTPQPLPLSPQPSVV